MLPVVRVDLHPPSGAGLASKEKGRVSVKLHCTLMNTSFLVRDLEESNPRHQELNNSTFDASAVIKARASQGLSPGSCPR